jgi:hypothetical protein
MRTPAAFAIALLGFGCSSAVNPSPATTEAPIAATSQTSLGTLRTRDREVLLLASPTGLRVTVKAKSGEVVAERVDVDELRTLDPHLYDMVRSGVATRPYFDATLDTPLRTGETRDQSNKMTLPRR